MGRYQACHVFDFRGELSYRGRKGNDDSPCYMRDDRLSETYLRLPQMQANEGFRREVVRAQLKALGRGFEGILKEAWDA